VILATAPSGKAMSTLVGGLGVNGTMVVVGASMDSIEVAPNQLFFDKKGIKGWAGGIPTDSQDTLRFAEMIRCAADDRKVPVHEGCRRLRPHDERKSRIPDSPDHVRSRSVR
jgi:D-arabinose 1-dehydrogenase-like Zn-dependent alcohol dehydrogenase